MYTHKKWQILYTFAKKNKNDKYCTNFANVYNICQFLRVYNINLHCKYNVYIYIYIYIKWMRNGTIASLQ